MAFPKRSRRQTPAHTDELRDDDGVDPRVYFRKSSHRPEQRKLGQLCKQVAETLSLVLASEFDDPRLHNLQVLSVAPAPHAGQLLVTVACDGVQSADDVLTIQSLLALVQGRLRSEVAAAITRKRAPRLSFHVAALRDGEALDTNPTRERGPHD
jgi:ribosome-binding factor A